MADIKDQTTPSTLRNMLPALAFCAGLLLLVIFAYDTGYSALPSPSSENRYSTARSHVADLKEDKKRSSFRDQWLKLADEFYDIYQKDSKWPNRPAALFRSAETLEELGKRSFAQKDFEKAVQRYELLAKKHADSCLADDALLRAAVIRHENLNDTKGALRNLQQIRQEHPKDDMVAEAAALERKLQTPAPQAPLPAPTTAQQAPQKNTAEITRIAWRTLSKEKVQITIELDKDAKWEAALHKADKNQPSRLVLHMENTSPAAQITAGARVKESLLTQVIVRQKSKDTTTLGFDLSGPTKYSTQVKEKPFRIILTLLAESQKTPPAVQPRKTFSEMRHPLLGVDAHIERKKHAAIRQTAQQPTPAPPPRDAVSKNMAAQLGLQIHTIFIDAGHGGKDPGTMHNEIIERELVLDIAKRVGRFLQAAGLNVQYARTRNVHVPLSARPQKANSGSADLFVSIHLNANNNKALQGFETYYLDFARNAEAARVATLENATSDRTLGDMQKVMADIMLNARTSESRDLAQDVQRMSLMRLKRRGYTVMDGGVRSAPFHVLIGTSMPAVLVEVGYCTNKNEANRLKTVQYRHALAEGIAEGILEYKNTLHKRQSAQFILTGEQADAI